MTKVIRVTEIEESGLSFSFLRTTFLIAEEKNYSFVLLVIITILLFFTLLSALE